MTFTGIRPQWVFRISSVNYQQDPATMPVRTPIGVVEPSDEVTIVTELSRPGRLEIPLNLQSVHSYIYDALVNLGNPPLEIEAVAPNNSIVFAGPIVGFNVESRSRLTLEAKNHLHYLDMMKLHFPYRPDEPKTMGEICKFLINQAQNLAPYATEGYDIEDLLDSYTNHGLRARPLSGPTYTIQPGEDGEPALDPRDGRTILEIIQDYSERGPEYGFDFQINFESASGDVPDEPAWWFRLGSNGDHSNQIGEDISDRMVLKDEHLLNRIGATTSLLPENFCTAVYALGSGQGASAVGSLNADGTFVPSDEDGRPWYYAIADAVDENAEDGLSPLARAGLRIYSVNSETTLSDDEDEPYSLQTVAEAYLTPRTEKYLIPSDMEIEVDTNSAVWNNPVNRGLIAAYGTMDVGDTITLDLQTGFGRGVAPKARISQKTITIGSRVTMNLEFL